MITDHSQNPCLKHEHKQDAHNTYALMVTIHPDYFAAGGNRHPTAADWDTASGVLAYGAGRNVALWRPLEYQGLHALLRGHTDKVNAIKFFSLPTSKLQIIISGSVDKTVRLWRANPVRSVGFESAAVLEGHENSVNCIAVASAIGVVATGSADATVRIWHIDVANSNLQIQLLQIIPIKPRYFPLTLALSAIGSKEDLLLAVAGTKSFVQIYVAEANENIVDFGHRATLAGHEDWIRSLTITSIDNEPESGLLLASASQDKYIRIWRIHSGEKNSHSNRFGHVKVPGNSDISLSNKEHRFIASEKTYSLTFEALLLGHEDWIYTVSWRSNSEKIQLLSASADNSLAIWEADVTSGIWLCITRLGEISTQKGSTTATGSIGGFWIGLWSPNGETVVSLGRTGSWRLWNYNRRQDRWIQGIGISGHVKSVTSIAWAKNGAYMLSTGLDQTTRLHALWKREARQSWHEFARPQVHGYDLNCVDSLGQSQFISGADEKLIRVFDEPRDVAELLEKLCGISSSSNETMPSSANIPALGLSNKAVEPPDYDVASDAADLDDQKTGEPTTALARHALNIDHPPFEDHLARNTLWPEREKLYGHGYEISAAASSHDGTIVATACRASSIDHAVIRMYETKGWREVLPSLKCHSLTVTCLRFSDDDHYLLSVGRDRQWAVFEKDDVQGGTYILKSSNPKGHSRMILSASWVPIKAGRMFATGGRDKVVKLWHIQTDKAVTCRSAIPAASSVTAVDFFSHIPRHSLLVAIGTESGNVSLYCSRVNTLDFQMLHRIDDL